MWKNKRNFSPRTSHLWIILSECLKGPLFFLPLLAQFSSWVTWKGLYPIGLSTATFTLLILCLWFYSPLCLILLILPLNISAQKMGGVCSSGALVYSLKTTLCNNPEDELLPLHLVETSNPVSFNSLCLCSSVSSFPSFVFILPIPSTCSFKGHVWKCIREIPNLVS